MAVKGQSENKVVLSEKDANELTKTIVKFWDGLKDNHKSEMDLRRKASKAMRLLVGWL